MKDVKPDVDARQLSSLAGASSSEGSERAAAALRRSRRLRALAIVLVVAGALVLIVGPHFRDDTRLSRVTNLAEQGARGDAPVVHCPSTPIARDAVKPASAVLLAAAVICHYPQAAGETRPIEGMVPASQLAGLSADLNARSRRAPLTAPPGVAPGETPESWVVVGVTTDDEHVQLLASPYPSVYTWDGLGPGLTWYPSAAVRKQLAADLPR